VAGDEVTDDELMGWVAARVAPHKRIRRVKRIDAIPCSPTGKILRRQLREMLKVPFVPSAGRRIV
jgi:acyl-coenzyme A synthetase/AMP-(fatty) acid ligase